MAAVTQADFFKARQDVQGKITEVQQTASIQQIANDSSRDSLNKDINHMTEGVVDAAKAKFTLLEQQARNKQESSRLQKQNLMKSKESSTTPQKANLLRLQTWLSESLEDHVGGPQVQDQARVLEMMKGLSSRMDAMENSSARKVNNSQGI